MPYQVSMMGWVGSGEDFCGLGWVGSRNFGLVGLCFEKVTHDQLWSAAACTWLDGAVDVRAGGEVDPVEAGVDCKSRQLSELATVTVAGGHVDGTSLHVQVVVTRRRLVVIKPCRCHAQSKFRPLVDDQRRQNVYRIATSLIHTQTFTRTATSQPIWIKILHTPIVVRNTLVGRLRPQSAHGRFQAKPERLCFFSVILITHPTSYIETPDRRDFGGKQSKWRWGRVLSWKMPKFCSVGGARSKNQHFSRFRVPFDYHAHSLQETVLPQTNGTDGKPRLRRCAFC